MPLIKPLPRYEINPKEGTAYLDVFVNGWSRSMSYSLSQGTVTMEAQHGQMLISLQDFAYATKSMREWHDEVFAKIGRADVPEQEYAESFERKDSKAYLTVKHGGNKVADATYQFSTDQIQFSPTPSVSFTFADLGRMLAAFDRFRGECLKS